MQFSPTKLKRWGTAYLFLLPTLVIMGTFQFFPMIQAFFISLYDMSLMNMNEREFVGLGNFKELAQDEAFHLAIKNSLLYLLVVPFMIICSLALAMLVEPKLPAIGFFRACYYVPVVTMMVVVALAWKEIFNTNYGLLNKMLMGMGIIDEGIPWLTSPAIALFTIMSVTLWKGLGYYMVLFIVALRTVPIHLKEAARIDGASVWSVFRHVTVPSIWPTISLVAILSSISALQVFEEIYVMTGGRIQTATIVYEIYETGFDVMGGGLEMGYACAMGVVLFFMLLVFTAISVKMTGKAYKSS